MLFFPLATHSARKSSHVESHFVFPNIDFVQLTAEALSPRSSLPFYYFFLKLTVLVVYPCRVSAAIIGLLNWLAVLFTVWLPTPKKKD